MNIVLSCCGEGFGHAARQIALAQKLREKHRIICFCPPSVSGFVRAAIPDVTILHIPVLSFAKKGGRIQYVKTITRNLLTVVRMPVIVNQLCLLLSEFGIDAVISDFDPFSSLAAQRLGLPNLEINHPGIILRTFSLSPDALIAQLVALFMESVFTKKINCSFYDGDVGPIIRDEIVQAEITTADFFLVYFTGSKRQKVLEILSPFKKVNFKIFPDHRLDFVESLASCKGVITTAGHQMISEAMYLKKPLFVIPQRGQYEQRLNAKMLKKSGWGEQGSIKNLQESLISFIENIENYPGQAEEGRHVFSFADDRQTAVERIDEFLQAACGKKSKKGYKVLDRIQPLVRSG